MTNTPTGDSSAQLPDELFRMLVESVQDYAIFLLDTDGYILTWNTGAQRIKGYEAEEIIGRHFSTFYSAQEVRRGKPEYELRVAADEGRWEEEGWRFRKDGTRFWANVVITALVDRTGTLIGFAKVTRDLTERRQAEQERVQLLALERAARADAEAALDRLHAIQSVTEAALAQPNLDAMLNELLRRTGELLSVDTAAVLLIDEDDPDTLVAQGAMGLEAAIGRHLRVPVGQGFFGQIAAQRNSVILDQITQVGDVRSLLHRQGIHSLMAVPLVVEDRVLGVLHVGTFQYRHFTEVDLQFLQIVADRLALAIDHSRLFEAERSARQHAEITTATLRARDQFLSVAAHELKTPMTSLRAAAQLLLRYHSRGRPLEQQQLVHALSTIEGQVMRLGRLVDQLLDTMRLQGSRLSLEPLWTDLAMLVADAVDQARLRASHHMFTLDAPRSLEVDVDPIRMEQVLTNLLDNAAKYSPPETRIDVCLTQPTPTLVELSVRDRGYGIPPEHRQHIFERFYQAHSESHRSGMGLGLFISREIVQQHGGTIRVEHPADQGTRFVVTLPVHAAVTTPHGVREEGVA